MRKRKEQETEKAKEKKVARKISKLKKPENVRETTENVQFPPNRAPLMRKPRRVCLRNKAQQTQTLATLDVPRFTSRKNCPHLQRLPARNLLNSQSKIFCIAFAEACQKNARNQLNSQRKIKLAFFRKPRIIPLIPLKQKEIAACTLYKQ